MSIPIILTSSNLEDAQIISLRHAGRLVAGISGTVGSVPASLRRLLQARPELLATELEVTTLLGQVMACACPPCSAPNQSPLQESGETP